MTEQADEMTKAVAETNQAVVDVLDYVGELEKFYDAEIEAVKAKQADLHEAKLHAFNQAQLNYRIQLDKVKHKINFVILGNILAVLLLGTLLCLK